MNYTPGYKAHVVRELQDPNLDPDKCKVSLIQYGFIYLEHRYYSYKTDDRSWTNSLWYLPVHMFDLYSSYAPGADYKRWSLTDSQYNCRLDYFDSIAAASPKALNNEICALLDARDFGLMTAIKQAQHMYYKYA
jgi:hypothetical protein